VIEVEGAGVETYANSVLGSGAGSESLLVHQRTYKLAIQVLFDHVTKRPMSNASLSMLAAICVEWETDSFHDDVDDWTGSCCSFVPSTWMPETRAHRSWTTHVTLTRSATSSTNFMCQMARRSAGFISKKPHRKSRGGCSTCKRKKVKVGSSAKKASNEARIPTKSRQNADCIQCDEGQPLCGYCSLRRLSCVYPQESPASPASTATLSNGSPPTDVAVDEDLDFNDTSTLMTSWLVPAVQTTSGTISKLNSELLHHYRTFTWQTLTPRDDHTVVSVHRDSVPRLSLSHNYLYYALLSIAAAHSNTLAPSMQAAQIALVYRQKTFAEYSRALQNITADNYESVLVTGILLMSLVPPPDSDTTDEDTHLVWMDSVLKMSEGLRILASLRWAAGIEKLSVYPLICRELRILPPPPVFHTTDSRYLYTQVAAVGTTPDHPNPPSTYYLQHSAGSPVFLPPPLMELLASFDHANSGSGPLDMYVGTLYPVLHTFSPIFLSLYYYHLNPDFFVRVFVFCSFLLPEFLLLVKNREPRALVLIAWWWALAGLAPRGWWVGRSVEKVIEAIGRVVLKRGDLVTQRAYEGVKHVILILEREGNEAAAKSIFEGWEGVDWDDGPFKAGEWEASLLRDWNTELFRG
jgi:hypothetical protein